MALAGSSLAGAGSYYFMELGHLARSFIEGEGQDPEAQDTMDSVVRAALRDYQLTLVVMAEALGVGHSTVINWRRGTTEPTTDTLLEAALNGSGWVQRFGLQCLKLRYPAANWDLLVNGG